MSGSVQEVGGDVEAVAQPEVLGFGGEPAAGDAEGSGGAVDGLVLFEGGGGRVNYTAIADAYDLQRAGRDCDHARATASGLSLETMNDLRRSSGLEALSWVPQRVCMTCGACLEPQGGQ